LLYGADVKDIMHQPPKMQNQTTIQGELEQKRADFVKMMEEITPREVLDSIRSVDAGLSSAPSEWPEFITQTHGACYAS
jgi:hypothetical protein